VSGSVAGLPDHEDHDHDDDRPEQGSVDGGVAPLTVVRIRRATLAGRFVLVAGVGPGDEHDDREEDQVQADGDPEPLVVEDPWFLPVSKINSTPVSGWIRNTTGSESLVPIL